MLEAGPGFASALRNLPRHLHGAAVSSALAAWLFAVMGPTMIVLGVAAARDLPPATVTAWIFGIYLMGAVMTLVLCLYYQQPIAGAFAVPAIILVGGALEHLSYHEVVGAYLLAGVVIFFLGATGLVQKAMRWLPMPVMMGMVAAVLLPMALGIVGSLQAAPLLAGSTMAVFLLCAGWPLLARRVPPVLAAIAAGLAAAGLTGSADWSAAVIRLVEPQIFTPTFSVAAAVELVLPLVLTTIAVQNPQGIAALTAMGYRPPITAMTVSTGLASIAGGFLGASTACIAGPSTAIIASANTGAKEGRYGAGVLLALMWLVFAALAPVAASITTVLPMALIRLLGGLALIGVLTSFFAAAFGGRFRLGALFAFVITLSGITLWSIGAPFWGLVGGTAASAILEQDDFRQMRATVAA